MTDLIAPEELLGNSYKVTIRETETKSLIVVTSIMSNTLSVQGETSYLIVNKVREEVLERITLKQAILEYNKLK